MKAKVKWAIWDADIGAKYDPIPYCPNCEHSVQIKNVKCSNCGADLDWREIEKFSWKSFWSGFLKGSAIPVLWLVWLFKRMFK